MKKYIICILCCILFFTSCGNQNLAQKEWESIADSSEKQTGQASAPQQAGNPPVPDASSFSTMILAEGNMVLQQDYYPLEGEDFLAFQDALMSSQWREPVGYQPKGEFLSPCVIVEGADHNVMYISPANQEYVFDDTLIFIKYGKDQQYSAAYFAPGEVAQKVETLREKWKSTVGADGLSEFDMPVQSIPQPDGAPPMISPEGAVEEANKGLVYEAGKITITDVKIDGTTRIVDVQDEAAKEQILSYVDGMQASGYTVRNTPPGGGHIIDVAVHRNDVIEQYSFSDQIVDGNTLGKNLQESVMNWTITDKDAYAYLESFFSAG